MIVGNWSGASWLVNGSTSTLDAQKAGFTFTDKGNYSFEYDGNKEEGTYKVENDMLFTKPTNQQEIMVKIVRLTKDSLTFDMNRSGQAETLILLRK
ncbi:MAG: lipocalin family protein [Ferruginibacter sp.]|nr:lipocalin family protein [Ferruginibacter sp.]